MAAQECVFREMTFGEANPSHWWRQPGEKIISTWQACPAAPAGQAAIAAPTCVTASDGQVYAKYVHIYSTVGLPALHTIEVPTGTTPTDSPSSSGHLFSAGSFTEGKTETECVDACQASADCQAVQYHADNAHALAWETTPDEGTGQGEFGVHPDYEPSRCKLLANAISWS